MSANPVSSPMFTGSTASFGSTILMKAGPYWTSFEQFRKGGIANLECLPRAAVGTIATKTGVFRIVRDDDFQKLLGLASEVHRIKGGLTFIAQAARVVAKHRDNASVELLINSVSMLGESSLLPVREGHDQLELTEEELLACRTEAEGDNSVTASGIPRPL